MQVSENQKFVSISKECKDEMAMCLVFFTVTMAKLCFLRSFFKQHTDLYTDAAQSKGFAGIYGRQYFFGSFSEFWKVINIMTLEFYPIILSIAIWGKL